VLYYYNTENTPQYKRDAKGQETVYTYDSEKGLTHGAAISNGAKLESRGSVPAGA
jgi:hypothetical protein